MNVSSAPLVNVSKGAPSSQAIGFTAERATKCISLISKHNTFNRDICACCEKEEAYENKKEVQGKAKNAPDTS